MTTALETIAPASTVERDRKRRDDDITQATADLDPTAGIGWTLELEYVIQIVLDGVNATEVNLAPNSGLAMAIINIQGILDGTFHTRTSLEVH